MCASPTHCARDWRPCSACRARGIVRIDPAVERREDVIALARQAAGDGLTIVLEATAKPTTAPVERWAQVPAPESRAAWRETRRTYEEMGATGVTLPWAPRLRDPPPRPAQEDDRPH